MTIVFDQINHVASLDIWSPKVGNGIFLMRENLVGEEQLEAV